MEVSRMPQGEELRAGAGLVLVHEWVVSLAAPSYLGDNEAVTAAGMVAGALESFLRALRDEVSAEVDSPVTLNVTK